MLRAAAPTIANSAPRPLISIPDTRDLLTRATPVPNRIGVA